MAKVNLQSNQASKQATPGDNLHMDLAGIHSKYLNFIYNPNKKTHYFCTVTVISQDKKKDRASDTSSAKETQS